MADALCQSGEAEAFKFGWHVGLFGLTLTAAAYNAMAWSQRKDRHLLINAIVYLGIAFWESRQMQRHLTTLRGEPR